jgi:hypothetical protein
MATATRRAIYGKLAGDTTLNNLLGAPPAGWAKSIYHNQAPGGATYPLIVFFKSAGTPTDAFAKPGAFENEVWTVKAVDRNTSADNAEAIAARVKALLNDASLSISGATHLYLRRQSDIEYPEVEDGVVHHHVGSLYRLVYES